MFCNPEVPATHRSPNATVPPRGILVCEVTVFSWKRNHPRAGPWHYRL